MDKRVSNQGERDVQLMLQKAPFGAFQADMDGYFFFFNSAWELITGLPAQESLGKEWLKLVLEADRAAVKKAIDKAIKERRESFSFQCRIRQPENSIRYCHVDARPVFNEHGKQQYFIGYVQDITEQQTIYEQLGHAEKRNRELSTYLHSMISAIDDIIFELDGHLVFRQVWVRDESTLFMPKEQFLGKSVYEVFGDQASLFTNPLEEAIRTGKETSVEYPHMDAAIGKWYRAKAVPVEKTADLNEYRLALIVQDITDRVRYLEELKQEKEKLAWYNSLYDFSNSLGKIASWEYDVATGETVGTKQLYLIVETEPEARSAPEGAYSFLDEVSKKILQQNIQRTVEENLPYDIDLGVITAKGNRKWIRSIGIPVMEGDVVVKVRGVLMDITDQVNQRQELGEIQEELARNNQLLDFSQQLSATGGWEYNLESGKTFWTKQVYQIYEVPADFDVSNAENYLSFFQPSDQEMIQENMRKCLDQHTDYVFEAQAIIGPHRIKWVRVFGVPVIKDGKVLALRGAVMDITREKEDALRLLNAKDEAEQANRAKSDFLSVMSHEIRTPLNGIIGITNLLKLRHTPEQKEIVNNLLFSADHLLKLINDILDLSKMESNKLELVQMEIDLFALIRNIRNQFLSLAQSKGIRLVSLLDQEIPARLIGDSVRLSQILNNLVSNAVKYTDKGSVTLSIQVVSRQDSKVSLHFSVKDTGIGIPDEFQQLIFEDFRQAQQDLQRAHSGTGLGLAITKRLVELHHSQIFLESRTGKGSEFYFELTFDIPDTDTPAPSPAISAELSSYENKLGALKLLLVEDNHVNAMVTREQMEYFGIEPHCAVGGTEALQLLKQNTYHAAFVDLHMPGMDGYELSSIIHERYPDTEIVIFTADIMSDVRVKLAKAGVLAILNKPFVPEEMLRILLDIKRNKGI